MKFEKPSIKSTEPLIDLIKRFRFILFISVLAVFYVYLFITISDLTTASPSQATVDDQAQAVVKRLKVDEVAVENMLKLEEENIEVQGLFEEARNNPFAE